MMLQIDNGNVQKTWRLVMISSKSVLKVFRKTCLVKHVIKPSQVTVTSKIHKSHFSPPHTKLSTFVWKCYGITFIKENSRRNVYECTWALPKEPRMNMEKTNNIRLRTTHAIYRIHSQ